MMVDTLIDRLSDTLTPVRVRRPARELALLGLLALTEVTLLFALGVMRGNFGPGTATLLIWKVAAPGALAVAATLVAVGGAEPTRHRVGLGPLGIIVTFALLTGLALFLAAPAAVSESLRPMAGLACVLAATVFACPPALALGLILSRAAPAQPARSAIAAAIAAGAFGATMLGLHCPDDSVVHSLIWHSLGVLVPAIAAVFPLTGAARW